MEQDVFEFRAFTRLKQIKYLLVIHQIDDRYYWQTWKTVTVRRPIRPIERVSVAEITAVISNEITRGSTVIRMALTQRVPMGARTVAILSHWGLPATATSAPSTSPRANATRTRLLVDLGAAMLVRGSGLAIGAG